MPTNKSKKLVNSGVNIADIDRIDSRGSLAVGRGSFIDVNNVFEGRVEIGKNTKIGPNCYIKDSVIGNEVYPTGKYSNRGFTRRGPL